MEHNGINLRGFLLKCPISYKEKFQEASVVLLISVGQNYHEGEKLEATINFINERFKCCKIMVNDTLQRHTLSFVNSVDSKKAYNHSLELGKQWIDRNSKICKTLQIPYEIYQWSDWLNHPKFDLYKSEVDKVHLLDNDFIRMIHKSSAEFLERCRNKIDCNYDYAYQKCIEYLKEEIAVMFGIWKEYNYDFILYPGKMIDVLNFYREKNVCNEKLKWLHIKFRRNNKKLYRQLIKGTYNEK